MNSKLFSRKAKWIWINNPAREYNTFVCFRKKILLRAPDLAATIHITADSRYELFVNGHWLGHGPIRAFANPWPVDRYEIGHLLRAGENIIAVLVHHFGLSTFQYLDAAPGLIAEISAGGKTIATGANWKSIEHTGYAWPVPRISCQQGWEEQFDARLAPGAPEEWTALAFDDARWPSAAIVSSEHTHFELRPIPFLTRDPIAPISVRSIEAVRAAPYTFNLNPHDFLNKHDRTANHIRGLMLLTTIIHSPRAQEIQLHQPHGRPDARWKLNNEPLAFTDFTLQKTDTGVARAKLRKGRNVLLCMLPEIEHFWWAVINAWTESPVTFRAPAVSGDFNSRPIPRGTGVSPARKSPLPAGSAARTDPKTVRAADPIPFTAFGPFKSEKPQAFDLILVDPSEVHPDATRGRFDAAWIRGELTPDDLAQPFARTMTNDMVVTTDIYALSASERVDLSIIPRIDNPSALLTESTDWTTIHPPAPLHPAIGNRQSAIAMRFLLDFGHEVVGYHEFELDAAAGTIIDNHNFEFIQRDGRFNLAEGMNNSFRYICREGVQRYRTFIRRGFRYSWLTFRHFNSPIRIRFVRMLMSTYPQTGGGEFSCSDALLNDIWRAGVLSVRCCSEDTYTDCPTYEQTFWIGDARNEAMVDLIANGDPRLSAHSLKLAGRSLDRSPLVESQVPSGWQNLLPTWSFLWMRWAQEHFQFTGDKPFIKGLIPFIQRNIDGIRSNINDKGLFQLHAWNLFDWAGMDTPAAGIVTHVNCFAVLGLRRCADLAACIGEKTKAKSWLKLADQIERAINTHLWSNETQAYVDCIRPDGSLSKIFSQQTQTAAYISGVAKGDRESRCREIVHHAPPGFIGAGSPFYMFFLLEALAREGRTADLTKTICSYWGKQIEAGATTFWEMFHPNEPRLTRSHCHGWSAAPVVFLTQYILGIRPLKPGYAETLIAPAPFPPLVSRAASGPMNSTSSPPVTWAQGRVPTPHGPIDCYWSQTKTHFSLCVHLPDSITARIELPFQGELKIQRGKVKRAGTAIIARGPEIQLTLQKTEASS